MLVCGFDFRIVLDGEFSEQAKKRIEAMTMSNRKIAHAVFTDIPPKGTRDIGGEPARDSIVSAAVAVSAANPAEIGLIITTTSSTTPSLWQEIAHWTGVKLIKSNLVSAAVAVPIAKANEMLNISIGDAFWFRAPGSVG